MRTGSIASTPRSGAVPALAAGVLVRPDDVGEGYTLAPHVDTLLLDETSPAYVGCQFTLLHQPEMFELGPIHAVTYGHA